MRYVTKIYVADVQWLSDAAAFEKHYRTMPEHRKEKIDNLRFEKDKRLCMGAWLLLVYALKETGIEKAELQLAYGPSGKPYLADNPDVFFNLSHSGNRVMCAVSNGEVGCDVQKVTPYNRKLASRYFCPEEFGYLEAAPEEARDVLFARFWTLKESFIKNIGRGLSQPLREFCIRLDGEKPAVTQQILPEDFYFREFDLQDGYRYACCGRKPDISDLRIISLT